MFEKGQQSFFGSLFVVVVVAVVAQSEVKESYGSMFLECTSEVDKQVLSVGGTGTDE